MSNRRGYWLALGVLLAATAYGLTVAELWAKTHLAEMPAAQSLPGEIRLPSELIEADPQLGYRFRPNASAFFESAHGEFAVQYEINEVGLREPGMILPGRKPPQVLFLGDEFVEAWGVMREESFQQLAQRQLRRLPGMDPYIRILNGGVSGYGAAQSYLLAKRLVDSIDVDVIVFVFTALMPVADHHYLAHARVDDVGLALGMKQGDEGRPARDRQGDGDGADDGYALLEVARAYTATWTASSLIEPGDPRRDRFAAARQRDEMVDALYARSLDHVAAIARLAQERDITFMLLHLPLAHQVAIDEWREGRADYGFEARPYPIAEHELIETFCMTGQLACIHADDTLTKLANESGRPVYFRHEHTLTKVGHTALARFVTRELTPVLAGLSQARREAAEDWVRQMRAVRQGQR